jgi:hypothetical protein
MEPGVIADARAAFERLVKGSIEAALEQRRLQLFLPRKPRIGLSHPKTVKKFRELLHGRPEVTKEKLQDAGFDPETIQKFEELSKIGTKVIRAARRVTPYLTKEQLQDTGIDPEKIQKFTELFPYGTEVTCELCVKHPDIFSFGKQGAQLLSAMNAINDMPHSHSQYDAQIAEAASFRFLRYVVAHIKPWRQRVDRIENEFMLEQALAFYKASKYSDFYHEWKTTPISQS